MYIKDGIAYAENAPKPIRVSGVRPMENNRLWIRFTNGEAKVFDFTMLLDSPAFAPLKERAIFMSVYIDYGMTVWKDGEIDIAPEYLYENGETVDQQVSA